MKHWLIVVIVMLGFTFAQSPGEGEAGMLQGWTSNEAQGLMHVIAPWEEFGAGYECPPDVQQDLASYDMVGWDCLQIRAPLARVTGYVEHSLQAQHGDAIRWAGDWYPWDGDVTRSIVLTIYDMPMGITAFASGDGWTMLVIVHYHWP